MFNYKKVRELEESELNTIDTATTRRYPLTVIHGLCDGIDKIFHKIRGLRFMAIFPLTTVKSAHVFPGNPLEFVVLAPVVVFVANSGSHQAAI